MTNIERIIRKQFKGEGFAGIRARVRKMAEVRNLDGLRAAAFGLPAMAPAFEAVIAEVERVERDKAKTAAINAEIVKAQADGCPSCGRPIKRNLSLTGWWQCSQFGAEGFRVDSSKPACSWQAFYVALEGE